MAPNQVSCNGFLDWINTNDLCCIPFTNLVILGVMEGGGCIEFIEDWIGLYVMECAWMNWILVLIRFWLKIVLITPLFLLVLLVIL